MASTKLRFAPAALATLALIGVLTASSQSTGNAPVAAAQGQSAQSANIAQPSSQAASDARARRRAARRRARSAQQQTGQPKPQSSATTVGRTAAQRQRDAQLLAAQKAQSAASAKENDALTQKVVADQQKQQAEPRIQDAPGPDSSPLPGNPAVAPAKSGEPARIQDAPGPAQTLPQAPPPTPAPQQ